MDYETGRLNWMLGDPEGWPQEYLPYFFTPMEGEDFEWPYEQHAALMTPNGDIMCFDNGHYRSKNPEHYVLNADNYSRGVRYQINTEEMSIRQVWQYGQQRGAEFFSPYICNVEYYEEGYYLVHSGGIGYEDGRTCEGLAASKSMQPQNKDHVYTFNSITCELKNDELMYELHVPANFYRAEKLPLYYANEAIELGKGQYLGQLLETRQDTLKIAAADTGLLLPETYRCRVLEERDRINVTAFFEEGVLAQVLLCQGDALLRYRVETTAGDFKAMCVGTFQKADSREVDTFINKTGLKGDYIVKILVEEGEAQYNLYETGVIIRV